MCDKATVGSCSAVKYARHMLGALMIAIVPGELLHLFVALVHTYRCMLPASSGILLTQVSRMSAGPNHAHKHC